jgi:hypothetical protein
MADLHGKLGLTPSTGPTWLQRQEAQLAVNRGEA